MKGHAGPEPDDISITTRLTPELVLASNGIESENSIETKLIDGNSYMLLYRMWGNHQKLRFQNKNMGFLQIQKETDGDRVLFNVKKVIVNYHNLNQTITANLICRNDGFNSPVSFEYSSRITDHALCTRHDLSLDRNGRIFDGYVMESINGIEYKRQYRERLMFDFTIYDMVISKTPLEIFTYYENLYSMKQKNKLFPVETIERLGKLRFNLMVHIGTALTERIFYTIPGNAPAMMVQNSAVYILDPKAIEATEKLKEELNTGGVHYEY